MTGLIREKGEKRGRRRAGEVELVLLMDEAGRRGSDFCCAGRLLLLYKFRVRKGSG